MSEEKEEWVVSLHPLAPSISMSEYGKMSEDQIKGIEKHYETIGNEQLRINRLRTHLIDEFEKLPFWKKIPCWLDLHNNDDSMARHHEGEPRTFARITFCKRCGMSWI